MGDRVLLIGSGGREHALAWKLAQSDHVSTILIAPGNAGTSSCTKMQNLPSSSLNPNDNDGVVKYCLKNKIDFVVVGPEAPLANGITDAVNEAGIPCFGPTKQAAMIECSKAFAKDFMKRQGIPTAKFESFTEVDEAVKHIRTADYPALVVKASGLAAGKGVIVARDHEEAEKAVKDMLKENIFGDAGSTVVIEEKLEGEEFSVLAFTDGKTIAAMPPAQDHKRLLDHDEGPNTGGMGAYAPCPQVSEELKELIKTDILQKTVDGMREEGYPYVGVLYAGIMMTDDGPKVLEFNCRFGDPETQVLLPLLKSDLYAIMMECVSGELETSMPVFHDGRTAVAVVLASAGYPASYKKGFTIHGLPQQQGPNNLVFHAGTTIKELDSGKAVVVTSGGRVLAVVSLADSVEEAQKNAYKQVVKICFEGVYYRKDIAAKACRSICHTYGNSGVNIDAGNALVNAIKPLATVTSRSGCSADLGGFGGFFDLRAAGYKDPLLVSGTDGVGTKLKIAQSIGCHSSIGIDLVAMCVNDVLAHGAEPLYFLDYFACGKLDVGVAKEVVSGIAKGCSMAGCALIGGETAEMPGMYKVGEYDVAGFAVGAVERNHVLPPKEAIKSGDCVIGLASSGIHSNGFSLVRRVVESSGLNFHSQSPFKTTEGIQSLTTLGEALLVPTKLYCKVMLPLMKDNMIKGFAHITGGGLIENIPRVLPDNTSVTLDATSWTIQPVFGWIWSQGRVPLDDMARTFNCGIGAVAIVNSSDAESVMDALKVAGEMAWVIGQVSQSTSTGQRVIINNFEHALESASAETTTTTTAFAVSNGFKKLKLGNGELSPAKTRKRVGVLISGSGTNLQALIDRSQRQDSHSDIVVVISNKAGVQGLQRAEKVGIPTKVINHKDFKTRLDFDMAVHAVLKEAEVELVCLAGFMRILTGEFVRKWNGSLINIHPSLLPSFKGVDAHKQVLEAGVTISGCTVHFVVEEVDAGAIITQEAVPVLQGDTIESLQERVKTAEHRAYPRAMELICSGKIVLGKDNKVQWSS